MEEIDNIKITNKHKVKPLLMHFLQKMQLLPRFILNSQSKLCVHQVQSLFRGYFNALRMHFFSSCLFNRVYKLCDRTASNLCIFLHLITTYLQVHLCARHNALVSNSFSSLREAIKSSLRDLSKDTRKFASSYFYLDSFFKFLRWFFWGRKLCGFYWKNESRFFGKIC